MAIKNASDLLVYKKTSPAQPQITRIKIKSSTPIKNFTSGENIIINNITDASGDITDGRNITLTVNSGASLFQHISYVLRVDFGYTGDSTSTTSGAWQYIDFTNGTDGPVPTLEVVSGTAEFKKGAIVIDVIESGQSLVYQPIAYSTSASISMSTDLRDITTKDSQGWQENAKGLGSFEMSTDALWDVNNAVGVESAVNDLVSGDSVDVKFSDRVRNLVATEEVYGSSEWGATGINYTKHLEDPFGQFTAAKIAVSVAGAYRAIYYSTPIQLVEGKKVTISAYIKGTSNNTSAVFKTGKYPSSGSGVNLTPTSYGITGYQATVSVIGTYFIHIDNLSTSEWTRVYVTYDAISGTDLSNITTTLYPGSSTTSQTTSDEIITASWQIETSTSATDYQNPTEVDCYQGKAFVNSVSVDAGVEDNATYSASFTGTSELFVNGLGHELLGDNYFDGEETTSGLDKFLVPNWKVFNSSTNATSSFPGYAKLKWTSDAQTYLVSHTGSVNINPMVVGKEYELTYTVSTYINGDLELGSATGDPTIPVSVGTHTIRFEADLTYLYITRGDATSGEVGISYISLKQVFS